MNPAETATFDGGRARIRVDVTSDALTLVIERDGAPTERARLPYPRAGHGGHELVVSSGERFVALVVYSGQSELGYHLFELRPTLRCVGGLPYVRGEGNPPVFSPDERWLAMATTIDGSLGIDDRDPDEDEQIVDWAELRAHALPDGPVQLCALRASIAPELPESDDLLHAENLRFPSATSIALTTPWGEDVTVPLPLPALVVVRGPRE